MKALTIYESLYKQGLGVTAFDSDKNTITFDRVTTSEILAISKTLTALLHPNEVILIDSLNFKIRLL
jgi:hypothetical protein